jgi:uncharacterized protein
MPMSLRVIAVALVCAMAGATPSNAGQPPGDAPSASIVTASAHRGNARSQAVLGLMYETGRGVPQSYENAVAWYRRAAEQGEPTAQYRLGLLYDKGQGIPQDEILAHKWLNLAASKVSGRQREYYTHLRDAVAFKLNSEQISAAQALADAWRPVQER